MSYVIKIGGSLLFDENGQIFHEKVKKFAEIIKKSNNVKGIICGGGKLARKFIKAASYLGGTESYKDLLGIDISRVNSRLIILAIGQEAYPIPVKNVEEAMIATNLNRIAVSGGFTPGQSTTTVAMEISEAIGANQLIIMTDVDGIYDKNPKEYSDAKKFNSITISELKKVLLDSDDQKQSAAGEYRIFDAVSMQIFQRSNIKIRLLNGNKLADIEKVLSGNNDQEGIGTLIIK